MEEIPNTGVPNGRVEDATLMIDRQRFDLALRELGPGRWERFEQLASQYLAGEFDNLRTMASPSGDRGRDAQLLATGDPAELIQYSVASDWKKKINDTVRRIKEEFPDGSLLVYVTNQRIGSEADDTVKRLRKERRIMLDVRDRSWFLDRMHRDRAREAAAEELAREVVDPLLAKDGLIERRPSPLSDNEIRAAVVHLELQWANDERDKGLSRTAYEALVRSALRNTDSYNRMSRTEVRAAVRLLLPSHGPELDDVIHQHTDRALSKLSSKSEGHRLIRHWQKEDEFCLTYEERIRLNEHLIEVEVHEHALQEELRDLLGEYVESANDGIPLETEQIDRLLTRSRRVLERFLLGRGEAFAVAVQTGQSKDLDFQDLRDLVIEDFADDPHEGVAFAREVVEKVVREIVVEPGVATQRHLRALVDAYTLLAFLQETPDVQRAVRKLFSHGEVWLDTNVLLPLFAERLLEEESRQYTALISAARDAGLQLFITEGVLEELERQMNRALAFTHTESWEGTVPFLYLVYVSVGRTRETFGAWVEDFMGRERPEDDLAEFLSDEFGIEKCSLSADVDRQPEELRHAVQTAWTEVHERRRGQSGYDKTTADVLARHDTENYLGVIARRRGGKDSPFGYSSWWLTLHRAAFRLGGRLQGHLAGRVPSSPVMSPDFLTNYLAFGPLRLNVGKERELALPIALGGGITEFLSPEIVREAERVREKFAHLPERRMRRHIRDAMDRARRRQGRLVEEGLSGVREEAQRAGGRVK